MLATLSFGELCGRFVFFSSEILVMEERRGLYGSMSLVREKVSLFGCYFILVRIQYEQDVALPLSIAMYHC